MRKAFLLHKAENFIYELQVSGYPCNM